MEESGGRAVRGVLDEASFISTERGTFKRLTIRESQSLDRDTGYVIEMLRSCHFHEVYFNGEAVSEAGLRELRGSRLEIRFLAANASEIRVVS